MRSLFSPVYTLSPGNHKRQSVKQQSSKPELLRGGKQYLSILHYYYETH